ncbi:MAG: hypothetical protein F6K09_07190 [Merismopedia sp. SIO2A8]|nr:hypothetical protein [Symploca sp. SIO2B6]NET48503.1 hypothetical protein [Merismopedia sp. SIO2A8]
MRGRIEHQVLFLHHDDVPQYKKKGSVVRNTYFWALRSIAGRSRLGQDWEYESEVWLALQRMLLTFTESGYLGLQETLLEFPLDSEIPAILKPVATWAEEMKKTEEGI